MAWISSRLGIVAVLVAGAFVASITACLSSDTSNASPDGGAALNDGGTSSGGDGGSSLPPDAAGCLPAEVQNYSPRWTPPKSHSSSCTADQIASYATCITPPNETTSAACAPWFGADASANSGCHTCLDDSSNSDSFWGPIVDTGKVRQINIAGCMAIVSGDTGGAGCAGQYQALEGCESAACATNCANASSTQLNACVTAADNGGCSNLLAAAQCVNTAGTADVCFSPQNPTFTGIFTAVATVFCLDTGDAGSTPDAGVGSSDSGGGTGDAGDAGDGG